MSRLDSIRKEQDEKEKGFGEERQWYIKTDVLDKLDISQYVAKEGTNFLRIIPPPDENSYFGQKVFVHYNLGSGKRDAFLCKHMMKKERCLVCERREELLGEGVDESITKALGCFPPRYLFFVVDMTNAETEAIGPQLYDCPQTINNEILSLSQNKRTGEVMDISDPDTGKVLVFERKGTKALNTRYSGFSLEDSEPIPDKWLEIPDFSDILLFADDSAIKEALGFSSKHETSLDLKSDDDLDMSTISKTENKDIEEPAPRRRRRVISESTEGSDESKDNVSSRRQMKISSDTKEVMNNSSSKEDNSSKDESVKDSDDTVDIAARVRERLARRRS